MNSINDTTSTLGTKMPIGEKIAGALILAIITYLVIAQ